MLTLRRFPVRSRGWIDASGFPAAGGVTGEADRDDQCPALEDGYDEERIAELLQAGDADGQDQHGNDGAGGVDAAGPYGGGAVLRADEGRQQEFRADRALRDLEARRQNDAGEAHEQAGADEAAHD